MDNKDYYKDFVNYLWEAERILNEYETALFYEGLGELEIKELKSELNRFRKIVFMLNKTLSVHIENKNIYRKMYRSSVTESEACKNNEKYLYFVNAIDYDKYLLREFNDILIRMQKIVDSVTCVCVIEDDRDFVRNASSLLHLVSSNNHSNSHILKISDDAYLFNCQFHNEKTPSMRVNNNSNRILCYGCGKEINIFEYLMDYESLDFEHALYLVAAINNIDLPNNPYSLDHQLVKYYQSAYNLRRFKARLESGYSRAKKRRKTLNNYLALKKYEQGFKTIERIKNREMIANKKEGKKRLILEMPNFESR